MIVFGSVWKSLKLDTLVVQSYAPGHSRFNPIERTWSLLTKLVVGVILPVEIEELDFVTPKPNENEKWDKVMDNAINSLSKFWHGRKYDGFPITVSPFFSNDEAIENLNYVHDNITDFNQLAGKQNNDSNPAFNDLKSLYQFLVRHLNRKAYQLEFIRCEDAGCSHCSTLPTRENEFLQVIRNFGGSLPTPTKSDFVKGHFQSLQDMLLRNTCSTTQVQRDIRSSTSHGICPYTNVCNYAFFSDADKKRHYLLMDHDQKKEPIKKDLDCSLSSNKQKKRKNLSSNENKKGTKKRSKRGGKK